MKSFILLVALVACSPKNTNQDIVTAAENHIGHYDSPMCSRLSDDVALCYKGALKTRLGVCMREYGDHVTCFDITPQVPPACPACPSLSCGYGNYQPSILLNGTSSLDNATTFQVKK